MVTAVCDGSCDWSCDWLTWDATDSSDPVDDCRGSVSIKERDSHREVPHTHLRIHQHHFHAGLWEGGGRGRGEREGGGGEGGREEGGREGGGRE